MSSKLVEKIIYESILNEIGELNFKNTYNYSLISENGTEYKSDLGLVEVEFQNLTGNQSLLDELVFLKKRNKVLKIYNINFKLNDNSLQDQKSNLKELVKILSTNFLIIEDLIKKENPDVLLIHGNMPAKHNLYGAIIDKNKSKFPQFKNFEEINLKGIKIHILF